jgi:putative CocE/NonD family hydrolase
MHFRTVLTALLLGLAGLLPAQSNPDSVFLRENYTKREVMIPMRDGVKLFTAIYTPKDRSRVYPILLKRTPYSCAPYGEANFITTFQNMELARSVYILVFQDVRGRFMSEGDFVDVRPASASLKGAGKPAAGSRATDEGTDTYDTAEWLVKNLDADNGRIGVYGISYPGFYATMALLARHPAIRAVSPQAPVTDWFIGDDFHHNGALFLMDAFSFYSGFGKPRPKPTTESRPGFSDWKTPDNYEFYLRAGPLPNFAEKFGMSGIPFWMDLMEHPDYDTFWQARNPRPHLRDLQPAVLTVGGLFDAEDTWGAWNTYKAIEKQNKPSVSNRIVMGPWVHGGWARTTGERLGTAVFGQPTSDFYQKKIEFPFFEYYLKDRGAMDLPEAYVFETGSNRWTTYDAWPPKKAADRKLFFHPRGGLGPAATAATGAAAYEEYLSDPAKPVPYTGHVHLDRTREYMTDDQRFAARRPDVLVYQTPVLGEALTVTGPLTAELWVSTTGTDADFVVKLIDVHPDTLSGSENGMPLGGYQMLVRGEIMRGRYRNSFEKPEAFVPGQVTKVSFELPDVAHTFRPGHRLMVQVQSSWFPLADRNPQQFVNIYKAREEDFVKAMHRVWHTAEYPSGIILPVLKN